MNDDTRGRRRRILFVTPWFPSVEDVGCGAFVRECALAVSAYHDVRVLVFRHGPGVSGMWEVTQMQDPALTGGLHTTSLNVSEAVPTRLRNAIQVAGVVHLVREALAGDAPVDMLHAHVYIGAFAAGLAGRLLQVPVVATEHATDFPLGNIVGGRRSIARLGMEWCDRVLPVSHYLKRTIQACDIDARFEVVPNVVDTEAFRNLDPTGRASGDRRILFVGLHNRRKGLDYFFEALGAIGRRRRDWHLDMVGDGEVERYEALATSVGVRDLVTFHGRQHRDEVARFMRECDFFVLPSLTETFGVVLIEAIASGRPVLATDIGGPDEIVSDDVGVLVAAGDADALEAGLDEMLDTCRSYSPQALMDYAASRFSESVIGDRLNAIYQEVWRERGMA